MEILVNTLIVYYLIRRDILGSAVIVTALCDGYVMLYFDRLWSSTLISRVELVCVCVFYFYILCFILY